MKFWKRIGWIMLGLVPGIAVFWWQMLASTVGILFYSMYRGAEAAASGIQMDANSPEFVKYTEQITADFMSGTPYSILMFVVYIGYLVMFGLWFWLMFCRKKPTGNWKQVLKPQRIVGIIGGGIAIQFALSVALTTLLPLFPKIMESYSAVMETLGSDSVLMILCVCLLAPIGEELIFRGLTFRIMKKAIPWQVALIVQALLFGIYHLNLVQGIYAACLGLLLGYCAHRYGSVLPGILLHMAVNSSSYLAGLVMTDSMELVPMIIIGVVALAAAIGFIYLTVKDVKAKEFIPAEVQSIPAN